MTMDVLSAKRCIEHARDALVAAEDTRVSIEAMEAYAAVANAWTFLAQELNKNHNGVVHL